MSSTATIARLQIAILFVAIVAAGLLYRGMRSFERDLAALRSEVEQLKLNGHCGPPPPPTPAEHVDDELEIIDTIQEILVEEEDLVEEDASADVSTWTTDKLKDFLKAQGKPVRGTREQLVERVRTAKNVSPTEHGSSPQPEPAGSA